MVIVAKWIGGFFLPHQVPSRSRVYSRQDDQLQGDAGDLPGDSGYPATGPSVWRSPGETRSHGTGAAAFEEELHGITPSQMRRRTGEGQRRRVRQLSLVFGRSRMPSPQPAGASYSAPLRRSAEVAPCVRAEPPSGRKVEVSAVRYVKASTRSAGSTG